MSELFYVMDGRTVVGNCASWWCPDGKGYCCNLDDAGLYTADDVAGMRDTDIPVPREVAERLVVRHVRRDHVTQNIKVRRSPRGLLRSKAGR